MNSSNSKNLFLIVLLVVILGITITYAAFTKSPIYVDLP